MNHKNHLMRANRFFTICSFTVFFVPVIDWAQNVGIGIASPLTPLDIKSTSNTHVLRLDGPSNMYMSINENGLYRGYWGSYAGNPEDVDFGTGAGNSTGKVHLTTQAGPRLTIRENGYVGINTTNPQWQLDVEGGLRFNGRLFVSGSSGTSGQVLTSNFLSPPSWQTLSSAYDNNIRFSFTCSNPTQINGDLTIGTRYNTNPAAVAVSGTTITFNQTGIYHFEVAISGRLDYGTALAFNPDFGINFYLSGGTGPGNNTVGNCELLRKGTFISYSGTVYASTDFYITAGQILNIGFDYDAPAGASEIDSFGYMRGYLISN
jgi:hypothetical protein